MNAVRDPDLKLAIGPQPEVYTEPIVLEQPEGYLDRPGVWYYPKEEVWELLGGLRVGTSVGTFYIPAGYRFDLATVPRALRWAVSPHELGIVAPAVHDALHDFDGKLPLKMLRPHRYFTRSQADSLFLELMRLDGVGSWKQFQGYNAVRLWTLIERGKW